MVLIETQSSSCNCFRSCILFLSSSSSLNSPSSMLPSDDLDRLSFGLAGGDIEALRFLLGDDGERMGEAGLRAGEGEREGVPRLLLLFLE